MWGSSIVHATFTCYLIQTTTETRNPALTFFWVLGAFNSKKAAQLMQYNSIVSNTSSIDFCESCTIQPIHKVCSFLFFLLGAISAPKISRVRWRKGEIGWLIPGCVAEYSHDSPFYIAWHSYFFCHFFPGFLPVKFLAWILSCLT